MAKGIIFVDIPKDCSWCPFFDVAIGSNLTTCLVSELEHCERAPKIIENEYSKPDWCPIRPVPEKSYHHDSCDWTEDGCKQSGERYKTKNDGWIPITERLPDSNRYILLSFRGYSLPDIGSYEVDEEGKGAFYPGYDDESYSSHGFVVNAWHPLPEPYREDSDNYALEIEYRDACEEWTRKDE